MNINHAEIAKRLLLDKEYTIGLSELVGEFYLSGISRDNAQISNEYEDCQVMSFILNDVTFTAVEDPNDGYRSSMRYVLVEKFEVSNIFEDIEVYTVLRTDNEHERNDEWFSYEECDILEFYDKANDKCIMRIGTGNTNDYYPYFVAEWMPENMAVNE